MYCIRDEASHSEERGEIEVSLQCADARERQGADYVFETLFSTLGLPWRLAEYPCRGAVESEGTRVGRSVLIVHYGDDLPSELRAHVATGGGVIHIVRASGGERGALNPGGDQSVGVTVEETSNGFLASVDFDVVAATLRCLSGIEGGAGALREDGRPGGSRDRGSDADPAQIPWVNHYLDLLLDTIRQGFTRLGLPLIQKWYWPGGKPFAASLSHDVDRIHRREFFLLASNALRSLRSLSRLRLGQAGRRLAEMGHLLTIHEDPQANFQRWLDLEREYGFRSSFYFLGGPRWRRHGARYNLKAPETRQIIATIARQGWEVGLHGSYYASEDRRRLQQEKQELEALLRTTVQGHRQHYLHLRPPDSWRAQEAAGFVYDTTYGYRFKAGFKANICFPFFPYDIEAKRHLHILELPLIFMDSNYRSALSEQGWKLIWPLLETTKRHHGLITFNFHSCGVDRRSYPGWFELYIRLLDCLKDQDAFVAPGAEIATWWEQRNYLEFVDSKRTPTGLTWTLRADKHIRSIWLKVYGCDTHQAIKVIGTADCYVVGEGQTWWIEIGELAPGATVEVQVTATPLSRALLV